MFGLFRFHCVGGCWNQTQDCFDFGIGRPFFTAGYHNVPFNVTWRHARCSFLLIFSNFKGILKWDFRNLVFSRISFPRALEYPIKVISMFLSKISWDIYNNRLNMEVDLQSLFGLHVTCHVMCTVGCSDFDFFHILMYNNPSLTP